MPVNPALHHIALRLGRVGLLAQPLHISLGIRATCTQRYDVIHFPARAGAALGAVQRARVLALELGYGGLGAMDAGFGWCGYGDLEGQGERRSDSAHRPSAA